MDGLAVDGFPEGGAFVVGEGIEEGFAEGGVGVEVLGGVGVGGVGGVGGCGFVGRALGTSTGTVVMAVVAVTGLVGWDGWRGGTASLRGRVGGSVFEAEGFG